MGYYLNRLLEPLATYNRAKIANRFPQLLTEPGIGEWLRALEPDPNIILSQQNYLVVDIETSGFNPATDAILSIGFVPIDQGRINIAKAEHYYISDALKISADSAVVNHITPQLLAEGEPLEQALSAFFRALGSRVPIAHGCWMEQQFIEYQTRAIWGLKKLPLHWLDTLKIEKARMANGCVPHHHDVRLANVRKRYHLPNYQAHNALFDAIATAELFLALTRAIYSQTPPTLQEFYRYQLKAKSAL
ncbi:3'-5' exonuclease [Celerinatantimonas yamalensis]|uniref:3'-5' exonuclease n=1 Tax=Celerinatantimonas yamalensis TaxID=559956 RepID=A0ABW9G6P9_9GAMM